MNNDGLYWLSTSEIPNSFYADHLVIYSKIHETRRNSEYIQLGYSRDYGMAIRPVSH